MATPATRVNGAQLSVSISSPVPSGGGGFWWDGNTTGPIWRKADGSDITLSAGGGSTGNWAFASNDADRSTSGALTIGAGGNASSLTVGNSGFGSMQLTGARFLISQRALTTGTQQSALAITGGAHTALTASTEQFDVNYSLARTVQWSTGNLATQRFVMLSAPTVTFVGASNVTGNIATMAISGAPIISTNGTLTGNAWALWLQAGNLGMGPNTSIANSSAAATNTTALTVNTNVATGAKLIGLLVNNTTDLTTGKLVSIQSASTERLAFSWTGTVALLQAGSTIFSSFASDSTGFQANAGTAYVYNGGTISYVMSSASISPNGSQTLGASGTPWPSSFTSRPVVTNQIIAAAASITVNPASGDYVRINLSATAITSLTISAGQNGEEMVVEVVQDGTGSRTIPTTWTNVAFAGGTYTATTTLNKHDCISFVYSTGLNKWLETGRAVNMS